MAPDFKKLSPLVEDGGLCNPVWKLLEGCSYVLLFLKNGAVQDGKIVMITEKWLGLKNDITDRSGLVCKEDVISVSFK